MTLAKTGTDTIAGTKCTQYDASIKDREGQICLTGDGVLPRARGEAHGHHTQMLEALPVIYTPRASAMFDSPPGFQNADADAAPGAPFNDSGVAARPRGSYWGNETGR